ncbi:MFS transporter [Xanthobacter tagetidis]|uniref:MFS transporter n=1 Tax=Xanthobacter tagetidis TaxID=60216 RepID=A0A3L7A1J5_9HYPH|nr:MFS transporter [Xanthobacter tagetidis]MBB6309211.1 MFS family permease [Xanthobacter tagetidis]RLP74173.1 MFS transporter [Xanthobacter tagetidis]
MLGKAGSIIMIVICQVCGMTLWFSATAAAGALVAAGSLSGQQAGLLTGAVQLGFVAGTLASALTGLADRLDPRRLFAAATLVGAAANLCLLAAGFDSALTVALRFVTGAALAGVYPVGMKMAAAWAERAVGLMIGTLVGALTLGSSLPYLFNAVAGIDWRVTIAVSTACALVAAAGILAISLGPKHMQASRFRFAEAFGALRQRPVLLANAGYLGHMWELYAMWAWIGAFLAWALPQTGFRGNSGIVTFLVIASGAVGSVAAGLLADRFGRTVVTMGAMAASGTCAAIIGLLPPLGAGALILVALVWGLTVVADSAQFSACIAELAAPHLVGTMLTIQTSMGFLLTFLTIQAMPLVIAALGWEHAFAVLAIGPALGVLAMWRLRHQPAAARIAGGRR